MISQIVLERKKTFIQKTEEIKKDIQSFFDTLFHIPLAGIRNFEPKISFSIDKGDFIVKTAQDPEEVIQALQLRHEVFYEEILHKKKMRNLDIDRFDNICDHLLVLEKGGNKVIGTYRFNSSLYSDEFYSATEFDISNILKLKGNKLELGRACIHKDHRNGITISLLWAGIAEYLKASESKYLFGCSSIKTTDFFQIAGIYRFVKDNHLSSEDLRVFPVRKFKVKGLDDYAEFLGKAHGAYDSKIARKMLPSLLKTYLRAGAAVCGEPALDEDFKCIDLLTLMDVEKMQESFSRKFEV